MVRQEFYVQHYWKVVVYYDVDYSLLSLIRKELIANGFSDEPLDEMLSTMEDEEAKAVTCSNIDEHTSFVLFNHHSSRKDYINSIVHEAEHVKQAMLEAYDVEDNGELPAYTIGYLVGRMCEVFCKYL